MTEVTEHIYSGHGKQSLKSEKKQIAFLNLLFFRDLMGSEISQLLEILSSAFL